MRSTIAILAVAAAAAPAFVSAVPLPQSGSEAISLSTIDDGIKLVGDAANAVPAIKSAWEDVFGRELHEAKPTAASHHFLKGGAHKSHATQAAPKTHASQGANRSHSAHVPHRTHAARDDSSATSGSDDDDSEAISLSTIGEGFKLVGDVANAVPSIESAWDSIFGRDVDDSQAISLSTIDDGVKLVGDVANAVPAIQSAWDDLFGRELMAREPRMSSMERLHRLSRVHSSKHTKGGEHTHKARSQPTRSEILAHIMKAASGHRRVNARSPITESEVDGVLQIAGDAFSAIPEIKKAWDSVVGRSILNEMD
ncbi:hypothetical protein WOLCODRAFT_23007 [Wolfiporia cocos MD-104 SS10]|uniref:Uncharacterized protein n=1 Tax=Wolfiporia cocos (strain MD-104) TaxID=742152 RepID=A0A2H3J6U8_WOLCO|nr:hypothetical protein WOLCODRAFT_23007 [Wolfiporia cocos MD-104 SS10]